MQNLPAANKKLQKKVDTVPEEGADAAPPEGADAAPPEGEEAGDAAQPEVRHRYSNT